MLLEQAPTPRRAACRPTRPSRVADGLVEIDTRAADPRPWSRDLRRGAPAGDRRRGSTPRSPTPSPSAARASASGTGLDRVVLGGGVFQNDLFTSELVARLTGAGLRCSFPERCPVGDGGIALGQVLVAARGGRRLRCASASPAR